MRAVDVTAIALCLACGILVFLRAELGRKRLRGYPDLPRHVRFSLYGLAIIFGGRAYRIVMGFGEADVSEALVYGVLAFVLLLQVAAMVKLAWCVKLESAPVDAIPAIKEAVREATAESIPGYLKTLAAAPADYEHRSLAYSEGAVTPVDASVPRV